MRRRRGQRMRAVPLVAEDDQRRVTGDLGLVVLAVGDNDHGVADLHESCGRAVQTQFARAPDTLHHIRLEPRTVVDVEHLDPLTGTKVGRLHEVRIDRDGTDVGEVRSGHGGPVQLGLHQVPQHRGLLSTGRRGFCPGGPWWTGPVSSTRQRVPPVVRPPPLVLIRPGWGRQRLSVDRWTTDDGSGGRRIMACRGSRSRCTVPTLVVTELKGWRWWQSTYGGCASPTAAGSCSTGWTSRSERARSSPCSAPTGRARPRRWRSSRDTGGATRVRSGCSAWTRRPAGGRSVSGSASCCRRRGSRRMPPSARWCGCTRACTPADVIRTR